jgi:hypothetical protein
MGTKPGKNLEKYLDTETELLTSLGCVADAGLKRGKARCYLIWAIQSSIR